MKLRVFYIIHSNYNYDTKKFKITRQQQDFPESATEETVSDELYAKYGRLGNYDGSGVLRPYVEIVSFTRINDEIPQRGSVDEWKATENSLLTPQMLQEAISYAPGYRGKRRQDYGD